MNQDPRPPLGFVRELRRRHVFRALLVYGAVAWVVIEAADTVFPYLQLPEWTITLVIVLALLGLPIAAVLAWALELTPEGVRRTEAADQAPVTPELGAEAAEGTSAPLAPARWPRQLAFAGSVAVLLGLAALLAMGPFQQEEVSATHVAVFPFTVVGSEDLAYLGDGMVNLLARTLDVGEYRSVDPTTVLRLVDRRGVDGGLDERTAAVLAGQVGAGVFVLGSITEVTGNVRVQATLYDPSRGLRAQTEEDGDARDLLEVVDRVAGALLGELGAGTAAVRLIRTAAQTTASVDALRAYLEAEAALRSADYDAAVLGFQAAVAKDSAFALAYYRLAVAGWWANRLPLAEEALASAEAHADRLGERDRRLLEAYRQFWMGNATLAERRYREILEDYPNEIEAQFQLAEVLHHYNAPRGRPIAEALSPFRVVLEADPRFACPI